MKLLITLGAILFSGVLSAIPVHNIVVFGDSLSDNGNLYRVMKNQLPQSPPYYEGRFSNGPVWVEQLVSSYFGPDSSRLQDYAYGGAGVSEEDGEDVLFTLRREINDYLAAHDDKASPDSLFVVWIGANNYLGMPSDVHETINEVNLGITRGLERLAQKGAKHILVLNLPDLGRTPAASEFGSVETMTYFTHQHNALLMETLNQLKQKYPEVDWLFFDLFHAFEHILENPDDYGLTNTMGTCANAALQDMTRPSILKMVSSTEPIAFGDTCRGYLFFDLVHPTAIAHKILSQKAKEMLDSSGIEFVD